MVVYLVSLNTLKKVFYLIYLISLVLRSYELKLNVVLFI